MTKHRSHSAAFKRQVAEEFIAGETLHALAKRHDISRQLIRIWVGKLEAGALDDDVQAADLIQEYEARIAALERLLGKQALELGLVDRIGTLSDTIDYIATNAKLGKPGEYDVRVVPEPKSFIEKLIEGAKGNNDPAHVMMRAMGTGSLADLAMPYLQSLDPARVRQVRAALNTLDLMQREGVILTTPELMMWSR